MVLETPPAAAAAAAAVLSEAAESAPLPASCCTMACKLHRNVKTVTFDCGVHPVQCTDRWIPKKINLHSYEPDQLSSSLDTDNAQWQSCQPTAATSATSSQQLLLQDSHPDSTWHFSLACDTARMRTRRCCTQGALVYTSTTLSTAFLTLKVNSTSLNCLTLLSGSPASPVAATSVDSSDCCNQVITASLNRSRGASE